VRYSVKLSHPSVTIIWNDLTRYELRTPKRIDNPQQHLLTREQRPTALPQQPADCSISLEVAQDDNERELGGGDGGRGGGSAVVLQPQHISHTSNRVEEEDGGGEGGGGGRRGGSSHHQESESTASVVIGEKTGGGRSSAPLLPDASVPASKPILVLTFLISGFLGGGGCWGEVGCVLNSLRRLKGGIGIFFSSYRDSILDLCEDSNRRGQRRRLQWDEPPVSILLAPGYISLALMAFALALGCLYVAAGIAIGALLLTVDWLCLVGPFGGN